MYVQIGSKLSFKLSNFRNQNSLDGSGMFSKDVESSTTLRKYELKSVSGTASQIFLRIRSSAKNSSRLLLAASTPISIYSRYSTLN
jgi:hypothetical protein